MSRIRLANAGLIADGQFASYRKDMVLVSYGIEYVAPIVSVNEFRLNPIGGSFK
jgi:hypothetical protein